MITDATYNDVFLLFSEVWFYDHLHSVLFEYAY